MNQRGVYNVSIKPRYLSVWWDSITPRIKSMAQIENEANLRKNSPNANLSIKARKRISNTIDWLLAQSTNKRYFVKKSNQYFRFRVNFITLTLASEQIHSDREIKSKLLNNFLTQMRQKWKIKHYLWRAEAQGNGNIHFHITTDRFVPWWELRATWNKIQNNLGYVDRFEAKHKHNDPNSTDVHKIKHIRNLSAYLSTYMSKKSKFREIEGKLWGLSTSLSKLKIVSTCVINEIYTELMLIRNHFKGRVFDADFFEVIQVPVKEWCKVTKGALFEVYQSSIRDLQKMNVQYTIPTI